VDPKRRSGSFNRTGFREVEEQLKINEKLQYQLTQQTDINEHLNSNLFQKQLENEDLRQRLAYMETICGRDSQSIKDNISLETSKVDWAKVLLDPETDDMTVNVSREKIAHEIIRLRALCKKPLATANSTASSTVIAPEV